nr:immunoglobulin heavy chain junction region [Macaca mulatta]
CVTDANGCGLDYW